MEELRRKIELIFMADKPFFVDNSKIISDIMNAIQDHIKPKIPQTNYDAWINYLEEHPNIGSTGLNDINHSEK